MVGAFTPYGLVTRASDVLLALLWLGCTLAGWRAARARRFTDHRRWMIRSFALTASIITNRLWGVVAAIVLIPQLDTTFHGDASLMTYSISAFAAWLGWTIPLLFAQWYLDRHPRQAPAIRPARTQAGHDIQNPAPVTAGTDAR